MRAKHNQIKVYKTNSYPAAGVDPAFTQMSVCPKIKLLGRINARGTVIEISAVKLPAYILADISHLNIFSDLPELNTHSLNLLNYHSL